MKLMSARLQENKRAATEKRGLGTIRNNLPYASEQEEFHDQTVPLHCPACSASLLNIPLKPSKSPPSAVVQLVGKPKFGIKATEENSEDLLVKEGLDLLKDALERYKRYIKDQKAGALAIFSAGDKEDIHNQTGYSRRLAELEMKPEDIIRYIGQGHKPNFRFEGNTIFYKNIIIAQIMRGADAYTQSQPANVQAGTSAIFKRHTLTGPSEKEYVDVGGEKLRRFAWRGITPLEREQFLARQPLRPINTGSQAEGKMGYSYGQSGLSSERERDPRAEPPKITDLEWLNWKAGRQLGEVPIDRDLLAFLQTRKGVGKLFSATSTGKAITSNHGVPFTGFGRIKIDLAKIPADRIYHHYRQGGFALDRLKNSTGMGGRSVPRTFSDEIERANQTVIRNREIVLSEIPYAAVAELQDTQARTEYESEFKRLYRNSFGIGYGDAIEQSRLDRMPHAPPELDSFPWDEKHFTHAQAIQDVDSLRAVQAGRDEAIKRIAFARAYIDAYKKAWKSSYEKAAEESDYATDFLCEHSELPDIKVPEAPEPLQIPVGTDIRDATSRGYTVGATDGDNAGKQFNL